MRITELDEAQIESFLNSFADYQKSCNRTPDRNSNQFFFKQFINNPKFGTVLLATQSDNKVFGFAILCIQCSTLVPTFSCVLTDLYVAPEARRHGWAQQLLTQSRAWAKKNHYKSLKWTTATDNQVARNLYDKIGTFQEFQVFYKWSV